MIIRNNSENRQIFQNLLEYIYNSPNVKNWSIKENPQN